MKESPKALHREGEELRPQTQDPARRAVATAMAKALCRLAHLDPRFSAAKPAGRIFATLILVTCCWSVAGYNGPSLGGNDIGAVPKCLPTLDVLSA
jgi:hypothetical protein